MYKNLKSFIKKIFIQTLEEFENDENKENDENDSIPTTLFRSGTQTQQEHQVIL